MYELTVTVQSSPTNLEVSRTINIGIRNLTHVHDPFHFIINGYPVFMKGSSILPMDYYPKRIFDDKEIDWFMETAIKSNFNTLRIWGGGNYMSDHFFNEADRLGILIYQDMMFGCKYYPYYDSEFI